MPRVPETSAPPLLEVDHLSVAVSQRRKYWSRRIASQLRTSKIASRTEEVSTASCVERRVVTPRDRRPAGEIGRRHRHMTLRAVTGGFGPVRREGGDDVTGDPLLIDDRQAGLPAGLSIDPIDGHAAVEQPALVGGR